MKKRISALLIFAMLITLVAGCKSSDKMFDYDLSEYVKLGNFKGVEYTYTVAEVTDEAVTEYIQSAMKDKGYGEMKEVKRKAKLGDTVNIDYVGTMDGVEFEGGTASGSDLVLGSGSFIPGFEDGLVGAKKGDSKTLDLTFPENYGKTEYAGKPAQFKVTVNSVSEEVFPKLTDEIVKEISEKETVKDYDAYVREQVKAENEEAAATNMQSEIWGKILESSEILKYPDKEVAKYKEMILDNAEANVKSQYNMTYEEFLQQAYGKKLDDEDVQQQLTDNAKNTVKQYMIALAIARDQDLEATVEQVSQMSETYAKTYNMTTEEFNKTVDNEQFKLEITLQNVMEFVIKNGKKTN